jgi:hypothetical protein
VIKHVGARWAARATRRLDVGSGAEIPVGASNGFANFFAPNSALFRKDCFGLWQTINIKGIVWIKWIGTHKDYDKIDVKEVQHGG